MMFTNKWEKLNLPPDTAKKSENISWQLMESIFEMWKKGGLKMKQEHWMSLGEAMAQIIIPPMKECYYFGYELASGNAKAEEASSYLLLAINPIVKFSAEITGLFVSSNQMKKETRDKIVLDVLKESLISGKDHMLLGMDNYSKVI
jgi:hypothetical protein